MIGPIVILFYDKSKSNSVEIFSMGVLRRYCHLWTKFKHHKRLVKVFGRLREHNMKLQPDKCKFLRKEVIYLGHIITKDGIRLDPSKLHAVENFSASKKIKDVQSFLELAGYYRKFIMENFSKIAKPLTKLRKKGEKFKWTAKQQNSFQLLKEKLITAPVLNYPDFQ